MQGTKTVPEFVYRITIKENLEGRAPEWLGEMEATPLPSGETLLTGKIVDQVALRGLLDQLWNYNLTIVSIERSEK